MEKLNINWDIFTPEEKKRIKQLQKKDGWEYFASVVNDMTVEKEIELQKLIDFVKPKNLDFKSSVREDIARGKNLDDPKEETKYQKKLDKEWKDYRDNLNEKNKEKQEGLEKVFEEEDNN